MFYQIRLFLEIWKNGFRVRSYDMLMYIMPIFKEEKVSIAIVNVGINIKEKYQKMSYVNFVKKNFKMFILNIKSSVQRFVIQNQSRVYIQ